MAEIPIYPNLVALVDDADAPRILRFKWSRFRNQTSNTVYARRVDADSSGVQHTVYMHREILNAPKGTLVDHKNRRQPQSQPTYHVQVYQRAQLGSRSIGSVGF